jgi:dethiobiotin synthetase
MTRLFVTGIGTGVGKTIASAVLTEALQADYWKPVQTGSVEGTDSQMVQKLISNSKTKIHPEAFCLSMPVSPHAAAEAEKVNIAIKDISIPATTNTLVIEGAGGLMVPLNYKELMVDLIKISKAKVILVVRHYLGSINHTLLSAEVLKSRNIPVAGIIYSGETNAASEKAIKSFCSYPVIGRIGEEKVFDKTVILKYAAELRQSAASLLQ